MDAFERDIQFLGDNLRQRGAHSGAQLHFAAVDGDCAIWLDGQEVRDMELDNIPVNDIEGMEIYSGPSTTPMQFSHGWSRTDCGAIVIWTRIPGSS